MRDLTFRKSRLVLSFRAESGGLVLSFRAKNRGGWLFAKVGEIGWGVSSKIIPHVVIWWYNVNP